MGRPDMKLSPLTKTSLGPVCLFAAACGAGSQPRESGGPEKLMAGVDAGAATPDRGRPPAPAPEGASNMNQDAPAATGRLHPIAYGFRVLCIAVDTASIAAAEARQLQEIVQSSTGDFARRGVMTRFVALDGRDSASATAKCLESIDGSAPEQVRTVLISEEAGVTHVHQSRGEHRLDSTWPASLTRADALAKLLRSSLHVLISPATY